MVKEGRGKEGSKCGCIKATGGMLVVMGETFCIFIIPILISQF